MPFVCGLELQRIAGALVRRNEIYVWWCIAEIKVKDTRHKRKLCEAKGYYGGTLAGIAKKKAADKVALRIDWWASSGL